MEKQEDEKMDTEFTKQNELRPQTACRSSEKKKLAPELVGEALGERLREHYNKFCEDKRLTHRRGQMEYRVSMKYTHDCLADIEAEKGHTRGAATAARADIRILDIGAGTGRYSVALADEGYDVTALELVKYNLSVLRSKSDKVKAVQGNALDLKKFPDDHFDLTLLFGPMYHLFSHEEKLTAMSEAKRVTRPGGTLMIAYCMNEYSVLTYAFREGHVLECLADGSLDSDFHTVAGEGSLYDYMRLEDIDALLAECGGLERQKIISPDGPTSYMRPLINHMSEAEFEALVKYQLATCERPDLIGAGTHTVDILKKM